MSQSTSTSTSGPVSIGVKETQQNWLGIVAIIAVAVVLFAFINRK